MEQYRIIDELRFQKQNTQNIDINLVNRIDGLPYFYNLKSDYFRCNFLLFGDLHKVTKKGFGNDNGDSLYLPLYLDALFKKYPNKRFDLLTESDYLKDENRQTSAYSNSVIENVEKQFASCYKNIYNKTPCNEEYPNLNVHLIDIRGISVTNKIIQHSDNNENQKKLKTLNEIGKNLSYWINNEERIIIRFEIGLETCESLKNNNDILICYKSDVLPYILEHLEKYESRKYSDIIFEALEDINRGDNKFYRYRDLPGYVELRKYIDNMLNMLNVIYNPIKLVRKLIERNSNPSKLEIMNILENISTLMFHSGAILTDYYTIIRMLKIKKNRSRSNIIMVAGQAHIEVIFNYIKYIDNQHTLLLTNVNIFDVTFYIEKIVEEYLNIINDNARVFITYKISSDLIVPYLEYLRDELVRMLNIDKNREKLLLDINMLLKIFKIMKNSKKNSLGFNLCDISTSYHDIFHEFRTIDIKSSEIEKNLL